MERNAADDYSVRDRVVGRLTQEGVAGQEDADAAVDSQVCDYERRVLKADPRGGEADAHGARRTRRQGLARARVGINLVLVRVASTKDNARDRHVRIAGGRVRRGLRRARGSDRLVTERERSRIGRQRAKWSGRSDTELDEQSRSPALAVLLEGRGEYGGLSVRPPRRLVD